MPIGQNYRKIQSCFNCFFVNDFGVDEIALECMCPAIVVKSDYGWPGVDLDHICDLYLSEEVRLARKSEEDEDREVSGINAGRG